MAKKGKSRSVGAPAWLVTFADPMSLLVAFFVLIISFSVPDTEKLKIAAGSIRAFGITREVVVTGVVELGGNPIHEFAQDLAPDPITDVVGPIPDQGQEINYLAAREELKQQNRWPQPRRRRSSAKSRKSCARPCNRSRSSPGSPTTWWSSARPRACASRSSIRRVGPCSRWAARRCLRRPGPCSARSHRRSKVCRTRWHTDGRGFRRSDTYDNWSLSLDRADATRRVLQSAGLKASCIVEVTGKADTDHMFANDPLDPRNRRISITLLRQPPPAPHNRSAAARAGNGPRAVRSRRAMRVLPRAGRWHSIWSRRAQ